MSTDRELLERAAKAAGITHDGVGYVSQTGLPMNWNPLTDDGDALRLAVKLGLDLLRTESDIEAIASLPPYVSMTKGKPSPFGIEVLGDDPYAATRRAIVRAAAAMGEKA